MQKLNLPLSDKIAKQLKAGDEVALTGVLYTARDQAHKRLVELIKKRKPLPYDIKGETIYYTGPTPPCGGAPIGSCGPTTSARMDRFTPALLAAGLRGMIGKGRRSDEVRRAIKKYKAVYLLTLGGAGALLSGYVIRSEPVTFADLGPEAVYKLEVKDFPGIVGIDSKGRDIYES